MIIDGRWRSIAVADGGGIADIANGGLDAVSDMCHGEQIGLVEGASASPATSQPMRLSQLTSQPPVKPRVSGHEYARSPQSALKIEQEKILESISLIYDLAEWIPITLKMTRNGSRVPRDPTRGNPTQNSDVATFSKNGT